MYQSHCALITPALPNGSWHSLTHARTLKALNKDAVAKLLALNAALKMVIFYPSLSLCYTSALLCMYVNDSGIMWAPFPVDDSGLTARHKLKPTEYHGVLRAGSSVNMFCM